MKPVAELLDDALGNDTPNDLLALGVALVCTGLFEIKADKRRAHLERTIAIIRKQLAEGPP